MSQDKKQIVNEHLRHNATSDTENQVRERRRLAELEFSRKQTAKDNSSSK